MTENSFRFKKLFDEDLAEWSQLQFNSTFMFKHLEDYEFARIIGLYKFVQKFLILPIELQDLIINQYLVKSYCMQNRFPSLNAQGVVVGETNKNEQFYTLGNLTKLLIDFNTIEVFILGIYALRQRNIIRNAQNVPLHLLPFSQTWFLFFGWAKKDGCRLQTLSFDVKNALLEYKYCNILIDYATMIQYCNCKFLNIYYENDHMATLFSNEVQFQFNVASGASFVNVEDDTSETNNSVFVRVQDGTVLKASRSIHEKGTIELTVENMLSALTLLAGQNTPINFTTAVSAVCDFLSLVNLTIWICMAKPGGALSGAVYEKYHLFHQTKRSHEIKTMNRLITISTKLQQALGVGYTQIVNYCIQSLGRGFYYNFTNCDELAIPMIECNPLIGWNCHELFEKSNYFLDRRFYRLNKSIKNLCQSKTSIPIEDIRQTNQNRKFYYEIESPGYDGLETKATQFFDEAYDKIIYHVGATNSISAVGDQQARYMQCVLIEGVQVSIQQYLHSADNTRRGFSYEYYVTCNSNGMPFEAYSLQIPKLKISEFLYTPLDVSIDNYINLMIINYYGEDIRDIYGHNNPWSFNDYVCDTSQCCIVSQFGQKLIPEKLLYNGQEQIQQLYKCKVENVQWSIITAASLVYMIKYCKSQTLNESNIERFIQITQHVKPDNEFISELTNMRYLDYLLTNYVCKGKLQIKANLSQLKYQNVSHSSWPTSRQNLLRFTSFFCRDTLQKMRELDSHFDISLYRHLHMILNIVIGFGIGSQLSMAGYFYRDDNFVQGLVNIINNSESWLQSLLQYESKIEED